MSARLLACASIALAVGCTIRVDPEPDAGSGWLVPPTWGISRAPEPQPLRPPLGVPQPEVEARLALRAERVAARQDRARWSPAVAKSLGGAAAAVADAYRHGATQVAAELIAAHPRLLPWDQAGQVVEISASYGSRGPGGGVLELTLSRRPGAAGAVAVAFPPGVMARPVTLPAASGGAEAVASGASPGAEDWTSPQQEHRFGHWPPAQDLALLRAPVLVLPEGFGQVVTQVPIACASFDRAAPVDGQPLRLDRFPPGSAMERLLVEVCATPIATDAEVQLAVWLCRDDITWPAFVAEGGALGRLATFETGRSVLPGASPGAARLLLDAGVDPRPLRFFGGEGAPVPGDAPPAARPTPDEPPPPVADPGELS